MDAAQLILTQPVSLPNQLENITNAEELTQEKKKQVAKDFESVLLGKMLEEMQKTVTDWDDSEDGAAKQIKGIFSMYLARDIANNGGIGMWKDIYKSITNNGKMETASELPGENI
ncbi:MAG: hypothetical protein KAI59_05625 [Planctomycetes bacterium]|nr:hypothetical protein [Planctomycetota bacterium]MCK5473493.1 hypothetical protein [Planctomycetota bacterium]